MDDDGIPTYSPAKQGGWTLHFRNFDYSLSIHHNASLWLLVKQVQPEELLAERCDNFSVQWWKSSHFWPSVNYKNLTMADYIKYVVAYYNNHFGVTDDQKYYIQDKKRMKWNEM